MDNVISRSSSGQVVPHRGWSDARNALLDALHAGPGLTALLGPPGTGKSMMLQEVACMLSAEGADVTLLHRGDAVIDPELHGVVLVDEADRMGPDALAALVARGDLAIVVATLPSYADRMQDLAGIGTVSLGPLDAAEAAEFVTARLMQGGHAPDLLTPAAAAELFRRSGGVPRVLHTLLGLAIFAASLEAAQRVTPGHVAEAVLFRDGEDPAGLPASAPGQAEPAASLAPVAAPAAVHSPTPEPRRRWGNWAAAAAVLLCLGGAAALLAPGISLPSPSVDPTGTASAAPASTAPAAAPDEAALLPPGSLIRVVLSYPLGDAEAARRGAEVARRLRADGVTTGEPVPVSAGITVPALLYYFAQDHDGAATIGRKLDGQFGEPTLARLSPRSPFPRPGTIELLLAGAPLD